MNALDEYTHVYFMHSYMHIYMYTCVCVYKHI